MKTCCRCGETAGFWVMANDAQVVRRPWCLSCIDAFLDRMAVRVTAIGKDRLRTAPARGERSRLLPSLSSRTGRGERGRPELPPRLTGSGAERTSSRGYAKNLCRPHAGHTVQCMYVTGLVNLYTRDIEAGIGFYRDLLGFTETFRTPAEGVPEHVELELDGFTVGLGTVEAARRVHGVDASPGTPAMVLVIWTDDVDTAFAELAAAGVPVLQPPHNTGNSNRNALLRDPDGNLVEIVAKIS